LAPDASTPRQFGRIKTIVFSLAPVLALLALLELGARVREIWYPPMVVDLGQGFGADSLVFAPDPYDSAYRVTHPRKTLAFVEQRFPARKPANTLRIAAIGESSVNFLDWELKQVRERLRAQFPEAADIEVLNCGGRSYGSSRLLIVLAEMLAYDLDAVMLYLGHNEFEELEQLDVANLQLVGVQRRLEVSALYRLMRDVVTWFQVQQLEAASRRAAEAPDTNSGWAHQFTPEEIATRVQHFETNLRRMIAMCQEKGVPVVLGTIPSNVWTMPPGSGIARWNEVQAHYDARRHAEGLALAESLLRDAIRHQSSEAENEVIRRVAAETGTPLADVKAAVAAAEPHGVPGETLFGDHCHLNEAGNRLLMATYEPLLEDALRKAQGRGQAP